jgi:hypothetical protein
MQEIIRITNTLGETGQPHANAGDENTKRGMLILPRENTGLADTQY